MPTVLSSNRLLSWALFLFSAYWLFGFLSDHMWYSVVVSSCLFVGGIFVSARAIPEALGIIKKDEIGPGNLAVIALALMSAGAVWTGAFNILYSYWGRPLHWIGPISSFGRAMIAAGFFTVFLSPEATRDGVRWPRWYILLAAGAVIAVVSFLIGYTVSMGDPKNAMMDFTFGGVPKMVNLVWTRLA